MEEDERGGLGFTLNLSSQVHGSKRYESPLLQDPNMDKKHTDTHILEVEHRQSELKRKHL